jgi:hypothetical protein
MIDCIDWNQSGTPDKRDQGVDMVTEWGRKNYREDVKKLQMAWEETHFFEVHSCFKTVQPVRKPLAAPP